MGGKPCIRGMGITVETLLGLLASGATHQDVLAGHPDLEPEDLEQAVAYQKTLERKSRADARRRRGMVVECFEGFPMDEPHSASTIPERIALTAALSRAAFLASGRELLQVPRAEWPGEIFMVDDEHARSAS